MPREKSPEPLVGLFDQVLPRDDRVTRRQTFGYPAAFVNGHLFASLFQDGFVLRLGEADRDRLVAELSARRFEPMPGRPMTGYVILPDPLSADHATLAVWVVRALDHVGAMPPKPAKARKPVGKA